MSSRRWLALAAALWVAGCGSDEAASSALGGAGGSAGGGGAPAGGSSGQATGGAGGAGGTATAKRSVEVRNPWGNVSVDNFVLDGDFELSVQTNTWFDAQGTPLSTFASGGRCRSGILCAKIKANTSLSTQPVLEDAELRAAFFARVDGACEAVSGNVTAVHLSANVQDVFDIRAVSSQPDGSGWCEYAGGLSGAKAYDSALLTIKASVDAVVDDVVLAPIILDGHHAQVLPRREPLRLWKRPPASAPKPWAPRALSSRSRLR